jgi:flagellar assembly protein FliH
LPEKAVKSSLSNNPETSRDIIPFEMPLLQGKTQHPLNEENISLNQTAEMIEREAYEKGFEAGEKAGFSIGEQKALVLLEKFDAIVRELLSLKEKLIKELEPQILELAVSIARKIILRELTAKPEEMVEMTKEALTRLSRTGQISISINPSLYDLFMMHKPELLNVHPDLVFDIDPSLSQYGSVVIGPAEEIVTDVDEQLKNLIREIGYKLVAD